MSCNLKAFFLNFFLILFEISLRIGDSATFISSNITNGVALSGGGIQCDDVTVLLLFEVLMQGNKANYTGGGIAGENANMIMG